MPATSPDNPENAPLRDFATAALGAGRRFEDRSRAFGRRSVTWHVTAADGTGFYLKRHEHYRHYATEVLALREWAPKMEPGEWWSAPEVVADDVELGAALLSELPGEPLEDIESTRSERVEMHRLAGRLAAMVHALDVDPYRAGPERLYGREILDLYLEKGEPYMDRETLRWIERVCGAPGVFDGLGIVPTHSDFSPRNWLLQRGGNGLALGLIDWERARPGFWLEDMQRVAQDHWLTAPELRAAFFEGYGRVPGEREERQLKIIVLMNAAGTVSWATEHDDHAFAELGRRTIEQLKVEL
jgi:hypothetical protein